MRIFGRRGIGRYNEALYAGLRAREDVVAVEAFSASLDISRPQTRLHFPGFVAQEQFEFPARTANGPFDIVHFTANTAPVVQWRMPRTVVTVHDIMYLYSLRRLPLSPSARQTLGRAYRFLAFHSGTRRCDHLITVSRYTADELRRKFGERLPPITVVHSGVHPAFSADIDVELLRRTLETFDLRAGEFFLHPGAVDPRKNTSTVVEAFARYRARGGSRDLVVMGVNTGAKGLLDAVPREIHGHVRVLPFVSNDVAVVLVKAARAVVFVPSEEGFGYPLVEAMAAGTPAIVSSIDVLKELSNGAAVQVPPRVPEALAALLLSVDSDGPKREALKRRGLERATHFTIANMANRTLEVYEETMGRGSVTT